MENEQATTTRSGIPRRMMTGTLFFAMMTANLTPADCFRTAKVRKSLRTDRTALSFRTGSIVEGTIPSPILTPSWIHPHTARISVSSLSVSTEHNRQQQLDHQYRTNNRSAQLPTWLSIPRSHLSEINLNRLQAQLRESNFSESEALKLLFAIEEAAAGDRNKVAGAAEFLLLLLETMDLGMSSLVAAAFHYCSCVTAREQQRDTLDENLNLLSFGDSTAQIARDAARLKELELMAARVMESEGMTRVCPNSKDAENLRNLLLSESKDWRALAIRSAASLYRLRGLLHTDSQELTPERVRTAREALNIYAPLASCLGMHRLKNEIEGSAFRILYRRQYKRVISMLQRPLDESETVQEGMEQVLNKVKKDMQEMLADNPEFSGLVDNFSISGRVKEPFSVWKKMLKRNYKSVLQVPDALALRVVVNGLRLTDDEPEELLRARERALCYVAQKLCTERWQPLKGNPRFKDYIERPKANGYQSLHYTAQAEQEGEDWTMEIQVRSGEMHKVAEFGLAAHWDYKSKGGSFAKPEKAERKDNFDHSSDCYLRKLHQWHWEQQGGAAPETIIAEPEIFSDRTSSYSELEESIRETSAEIQPYIEALSHVQSDLSRDFVFVFLKQDQNCEGKVLSLPAGACVVDALREGEKSLGVPLLFSERFNLNGSRTTVTRRLSNGDLLTVPKAVGQQTAVLV